MAIENYYTNTAKIQRKTETLNAFGVVSEAWADVETISCLINQATSNEILQAQQVNEEVSHKLFCDVSTDITNKDRIIFNTKIYRVVSVPKNTVNRNHHYKIMLYYTGADNE